MYYIYSIECETPNHFYVGYSSNVVRRINQHINKAGAKFTGRHGVKSYRVLGTFNTIREAAAQEKLEFNKLKDLGHIVGGIYSMDLIKSCSKPKVGSRMKVTRPSTKTLSVEEQIMLREVLIDTTLNSLRSKANFLAARTGRHPEATLSIVRRALRKL